ncbi:MAG: asparagine synthase (glutamine-hydrolyzing), partial [Deltaproteobacteria bacterium]|nr:asparagine synthase (glutamine-hydrolyzing) [Deltaproteobacteria bacterium]
GVTRSGLVFGSDLAALRAHPDFDPQLNRDAVALLLRLQYVPCPYSIYLGIHKLAAGHRISLTGPDALTGSDAATPLAWWDPIDVAARASREPFGADGRELTDEVERVLGDAVEDRMVADVPLGAFLSGGIDSSTVVALMQARSREPVKTFTIGFREDEFDEASHARAIAAHLGTDHTELYLDDAQARDVVPLLPGLWTEPFADPSQIPTYLVSRLARQSVTVSLSGDGGDELFGGYTRYRQTVETWNDLAGQPGLLKLAARAARAALSPDGLEALGRRLNFLLPASARGRDIGGSLRYRSDLLSRESIDDLYRYSVGYWHDAHRVVKGAHWRKSELERDLCELFPGRPEERMMLLDTLTYLPDDILTKVDRASMAVSLEARVPILDHRVFELAWRIPIEYRVRDGVEKWPLREVLARHVPRELFERPKQGFGAPVTEWLRGGLNDWGEALLDPRRLRDEGIFEPEPVRRMWTQLQAGQPISTAMWTVLVFQAWWENERGGGAS